MFISSEMKHMGRAPLSAKGVVPPQYGQASSLSNTNQHLFALHLFKTSPSFLNFWTAGISVATASLYHFGSFGMYDVQKDIFQVKNVLTILKNVLFMRAV